ncbi:MAG: DUF6498-containing protein [Candidatus Limnocylindrales bacterium]
MAEGSLLQRTRAVAGSSAISIAFLVLANLVPLAGVLFLGWDVGTILVSYWLENGIVGILNVPRMALAARAAGPAAVRQLPVRTLFFAFHYGIFWLVHGVFVLVLAGVVAVGVLDPVGFALTDPAILIVAAALLLSHLVSFVLNYVGRREYERTSLDAQQLQPYARVLVLHMTVLLGGFAVLAPGQPVALIALLVGFKTVVDLAFHVWEHRRLAPAISV